MPADQPTVNPPMRPTPSMVVDVLEDDYVPSGPELRKIIVGCQQHRKWTAVPVDQPIPERAPCGCPGERQRMQPPPPKPEFVVKADGQAQSQVMVIGPEQMRQIAQMVAAQQAGDTDE